MGNDGGSILKRVDMVKFKPKEIKVDKELKMKARARFCALTKQRLQRPIAACKLGYLYNYESIIKSLIDKSLPSQFRHIQKLKDLKQLNIMQNEQSNSENIIVCPITLKQFNGLIKFQFNWDCGCVVAQNAAKTNDQKTCIICNKPITKNISLNMDEEEQQKVLLEIQKKKIKEKKKDDIQEPQIQKKVKVQMPMSSNILDKINNDSSKPESYKNLFHSKNQYDSTEDNSNLFFRNVRNGIR